MTVTETRQPNATKDRPPSDDAPAEERKPGSGWSRPLARPVSVRGGPDLVTLADARTFLFRRLHAHPVPSSAWQRVTTLLLSAARSDEVDVADVTIALEMAANTEERQQPARPPAARKAPAKDARAALPEVDFSETAPPERSGRETEAKPPAPGRASFLLRILNRGDGNQ